MEFSPFNPIVKLCLQGMEREEQGESEEGCKLFLQAWEEATDDFGKFLAAYYVARNQKTVQEKLNWLQTTLMFALKVNDEAVKSAFPSLHLNIASCYQDLNDPVKAQEHEGLAQSFRNNPSDKGPFLFISLMLTRRFAQADPPDRATPKGHRV